MKKVLVAAPLALAAVFSVSWYVAASHFKTNTEAFVSRLNSNNITLSYDKISVSGFPFRVGASIKNLKIKTATGELIKSMPESIITSLTKDLTANDLNTLLSLENRSEFSGSVDITSDILARNIRVKFGDGKIISKDIHGEITHLSKGDTFYTLNFNRPPIVTLLSKPFSSFDREYFSLNELESVKIEGKNNVFYNQENQSLASTKKLLMFVEYKSSGFDSAKYRLIVDVKNQNVGSEYIKSFSALDSYKIILSCMEKKDINIMTQKNKSIKIDASAALPSVEFFSALFKKEYSKIAAARDSYKEFKFDLRQFNIISDAYNVDVLGEVRVDMANSKAIYASFRGDAQYFNPGFKEYADEQSRIMFNQFKIINPTESYYTEEKIKSVFPDLPSFGKIIFNLELKVDEKDGFFIRDFNLASDLYSAKLIGNIGVGIDTREIKPANFNLNLKNYQAVINDSIGYARKVASMINANPSPRSPIVIPKDFEANLIAFVKSMSDSPLSSDKEISIAVKTAENGSVSFGKLSNAAFAGEFVKLSEGFKGLSLLVQTPSAREFEIASMVEARSLNDRGIEYARGEGVVKDLAQAKSYFDKAAVLGFKYAEINSRNLSAQIAYPALIKVSYGGLSVTCEKYDHQAIDNFIATLRELD